MFTLCDFNSILIGSERTCAVVLTTFIDTSGESRKVFKTHSCLGPDAASIVKYPLCIALVFNSTVSFAQSSSVLEEIIVTATKRETSLQDTALSITAFDELDLQRQGAEYLVDYGSKVPNVGLNFAGNFGRYNSGSAAIRGVGSSTNAPGATGFYLDEVPVPEYMNPRIADVERVEILRGPQGTLFGARSMGGTVRVITRQADADEFSGHMHASVADVKEGDMNWGVDGSVNMPIIEGVLGARALAYYKENSGIFDMTHIGPTSPRPAFAMREDYNDEAFHGGQVSLVWHAAENITIRPRYMYQRTDSDGLPLADHTPGTFTLLRHNDADESGHAVAWLGSVTINIDTRFGEIVSTTAAYEYGIEELEDEGEVLDAFLFQGPPSFGGLGLPTGPQLPSLAYAEIDDNTLTHETRLVSDFGELFIDDLALTLGVFYEERTNDLDFPRAGAKNVAPGFNAAFTNTINAFSPPEYAIPIPPGALDTDEVFIGLQSVDYEELAVFGELTLRVTDSLRLTAGARWSDSEVIFNQYGDGFVNGGFSMTPTALQADKTVTPKVLMELDVSDDILLYGAASKGFRFGGGNLVPPAILCAPDLETLGIVPADVGTFNSDTLWNYELGAKSSWFRNRLTANIVGFQINWSDLIQTTIMPSCGFTFNTNSGKAKSKGLEIEIKAVPTEGLEVSLGLGLTDAKLKSGNVFAGTQAGDRISQVPEVTFNASAEYTIPVTMIANWEAYIRGDFVHHGNSLSSNNTSAGVPPRKKEGFELLDLRIGAVQPGNWEVSLFIKNVTNEHVNYSDNRSIASETPGRPRIMTNRPRTVGLEVRKYFN